jgi:hypothetical protein
LRYKKYARDFDRNCIHHLARIIIIIIVSDGGERKRRRRRRRRNHEAIFSAQRRREVSQGPSAAFVETGRYNRGHRRRIVFNDDALLRDERVGRDGGERGALREELGMDSLDRFHDQRRRSWTPSNDFLPRVCEEMCVLLQS